MVHDVTKPLPGEYTRYHGLIILPNHRTHVSADLKSEEAVQRWVKRMEQIYPGCLSICDYFNIYAEKTDKYKD